MASVCCVLLRILLSFLNHSPTPESYPLSLHDALPICQLVDARWYRRDADCDVRGLGQGGLLQLLPARRQSAGVATVHAVVPRDVGRPRELRVRRRDVTMVTRA